MRKIGAAIAASGCAVAAIVLYVAGDERGAQLLDAVALVLALPVVVLTLWGPRG